MNYFLAFGNNFTDVQIKQDDQPTKYKPTVKTT